jgi:acyl-CoA thioesterase
MPTAQEIAEATREALWARDCVAQSLGMQVMSVGPGTAVLCMVVRNDMLNGLALCHGGMVATLADSAFGFASNSRNELTVTSGMDINLLAAAELGDVLTATACEVSKAGRTGLYDVAVTNQRDESIALLRCRSYAMKGRAVVAGLPTGRVGDD